MNRKLRTGIVLGWACLAFGFSGAAPKKTESKSTEKEATVWVGKSDGALSCEPGSGRSLVEGEQELRRNHIPVLDSKKTTNGMMNIQMCGASSGTLNSFRISRDYLDKAMALGYQPTESSN